MASEPGGTELPTTAPLDQQKTEVQQTAEGLGKGLSGGTDTSFHREMGKLQELIDKMNPFKKKPTPPTV